MLKLNRILGVGFLVRGLIKELAGIRTGIETQNRLLAQLADRLAPSLAAVSEDDLARHSGVDHLDYEEAALVSHYIARTERDTGHTPTEDQIINYLADEKTRDLASRLADRDQELSRLSSRGER